MFSNMIGIKNIDLVQSMSDEKLIVIGEYMCLSQLSIFL